MRLAQTRFRNFRNLEKALIQWGPGMNVLSGPNGAGKSNVLEALHVITGWGAFSGSKCADTVQWGSQGGAFLAARAEGEKEAVIEAAILRRASLRLDGKVCRWGDLRNCVPALTFLPSDTALVEGSPSVRRRFLDVLCALHFPLYAYRLSEYRKICSHRRCLLSQGKPVTVTHETMAHLAAWLWKCRTGVLASLTAQLDRWKDLLPLPIALDLKRGGAGNVEDPLEDFYRSSDLLGARERAARTPLTGPHRDDLELTCGGRPAAAAFSRGQRRRTALALIMAAASTVEARFQARPVLIFDEIAAELDSPGRALLFDALGQSGWQVFAATAEESLPPFQGVRWRLDHGRIEEYGA